MIAASAARSLLRAPSLRGAAARFGAARPAFSRAAPYLTRTGAATRFLRSPVEATFCIESLLLLHSETASALMTSMFTLSRRSYRWLSEERSNASTRCYTSNFMLEEFEDDGESISQSHKSTSNSSMSLAKSLACLADESSASNEKRPLSRLEHKRLIELRIKKKVKAHYYAGRYLDLMNNVVATADTLSDSYDMIRLNSNVILTSKKDDICFSSLAEQLASGQFDVQSNTLSILAKSKQKKCLVLPKLNLKIVQEAIRLVLEVVYRPHFSKISHGCRSGRGQRSALNYVSKEINNHNWWFTLFINKEADKYIMSKLISEMNDKIEDAKLFSFIQSMFDARVLNLVFGNFPKGHGLPHEGVLSPILMNIYLGNLDHEIFKISMRYEGLCQETDNKVAQSSKLRTWIRKQIKESDTKQLNADTETKICTCRYMDEIFVAVSGSKETAIQIKADIVSFLKSTLHLDVEDLMDLSEIKKNSRGIQFIGTMLRLTTPTSPELRAVHKLKDKVKLFASQKQEIWDAMSLRIGKKWLAYGLRRIKESEIKQLGLSTPLLDYISQFRKDGMKTDHWFKSLLKVWMQDVNAQVETNEEVLLSKYIAEPALPQDLRDAFYNFQKQAKEYISSEIATTTELLRTSGTHPTPFTEAKVIRLEAPLNSIKKSLHYHGVINIEGFPRHVSKLILQDDDLIINWFSGLVQRWLRWYSKYDNFGDIKLLIVHCIRKSCIRTLAAKYRMHEVLIEKKFELEQHGIPLIEELDTDSSTTESNDLSAPIDDESLMYGIPSSGLCLLSLSRVKVPARVFNCFVMGCTVASPSLYTLHIKEKQRFPGWRTGFSTSIHPSLNGKRIGLCNQHVKDLYQVTRYDHRLLPGVVTDLLDEVDSTEVAKYIKVQCLRLVSLAERLEEKKLSMLETFETQPREIESLKTRLAEMEKALEAKDNEIVNLNGATIESAAMVRVAWDVS
ncbi:hypothetical protein Cni_G07241 [Canna indica]|uniref:Domain X domain-containing protein n=1 Tax=Canna indica TaxID=4628 RepID=A0AAQ3Q7C6_9LILI|nr:hypothetical protein Cni_G07241 [Canna indica]